MSYVIDLLRHEFIKARILRNLAQCHRHSGNVDMAEAEPEKPLPNVPLQHRGFGVMDE